MKYLINKSEQSIVGAFDKPNKMFVINRVFGKRTIPQQVNHTYAGDETYAVVEGVEDRSGLPTEYATNVKREPVKMVGLTPTIVITGDVDYKAMGKSLAQQIYQDWTLQINEAFQSVGITRTAAESMAETTERFAAISAEVNNGGTTPQRKAEFDAVKAFNAAYVEPMMDARNTALKMMTRFVELTAIKNSGFPLTPEQAGELDFVSKWDQYEWVEFNETKSTLLKQIIAIQLKVI